VKEAIDIINKMRHVISRVKQLLSFNQTLSAHIIIASIFIFVAGFFILTGYGPIHDAISWHGTFHYFYSSIEKGIFPYWNPYSQTGTPFYVYCQAFGLLEPSNFLFIFIQKITGCNTLTTYILHYLFYFFIFIIGTYHLLRIITKSNSISLLFSLVLFLSCFPIFMRQNGALNSFFLLPSITYFILMFFIDNDTNKKRFYFFSASYLFALTVNIYIPAGVMFFVFLFLIFVFLFRPERIRETFNFMKSRKGLFSLGVAVIVVVLISFPVLALYYSFHDADINEMFPSVRIFQKNGNNLVKLYVSDLKENLFSEKFTNNTKTSSNLWNLVGLIYEPSIHFMGERLPSEIFLYVSFLPLLGIIYAFKKRNNYAYIFLVISFFTLMIMSNFKKEVLSPPTFFQNSIIKIIPFLKTVEVLQNFGPLFLFSLIVVGAIGFKIAVDDNKSRFIWNTSILFVFLKCLLLVTTTYMFIKKKGIFLDGTWLHKKLYPIYPFLEERLGEPFVTAMKHIPHGKLAVLIYFIALSTLVFITAGNFSMKRLFRNISINNLQTIAVVTLLFDLLVFCVFHATHFKIPDITSYEKVIEKKYYEALKRDDLLRTKHENAFINYRETFSVPTVPSNNASLFTTFWGHEVYSAKKTAFPNALRVHLFKDFAPSWDHFYMTKYYYDYIVNISPHKQLATSHVILPILNFFPDKNTIFVDNKYEVVKKINQVSLKKLGKYIFIEKDKDKKLTSPAVSDFFDSGKYLKYSKKELSDFKKVLGQKYSGNKYSNYDVKYYDINRLSLSVEAPVNGYFYFGDGYSKDWKVFVDNMEKEIYKTNINFKSVQVPKGKHRIDFIYDPVFFRYSLYSYFVGNLIAFGILILFLKRMLAKSRKS